MKHYTLEIDKDALKFIRGLKESDQRRITRKIDLLADDPRPYGSLKLKGNSGLHRVRAGNFRILYSVNDGKLMVIVITVDDRKDVYKGL